ncbi:hypothetical protein L596_011669 [Steinernema carpocapsae]|uniref:Uncharacterized protein n=1 Tax=Steinernema carpocapsae TaxID=34508 RepID=A0A4U5NUN4_STECR|nr:hypothetical protein L596_011669 [Steinernema carpocapsae]
MLWMLRIVVFATLVTVLNAAVFRHKIASAGSLRSKLVVAEKWVDEVVKIMKVKASGSQHFIDYYDNFYLGNITLGTPGKRYDLRALSEASLLQPSPSSSSSTPEDTGSSRVINSKCTSPACQYYEYPKNFFDEVKSSGVNSGSIATGGKSQPLAESLLPLATFSTVTATVYPNSERTLFRLEDSLIQPRNSESRTTSRIFSGVSQLTASSDSDGPRSPCTTSFPPCRTSSTSSTSPSSPCGWTVT